MLRLRPYKDFEGNSNQVVSATKEGYQTEQQNPLHLNNTSLLSHDPYPSSFQPEDSKRHNKMKRML